MVGWTPPPKKKKKFADIDVVLRLHLKKGGKTLKRVTEVNCRASVDEDYFGSEENAFLDLATEAFRIALRARMRERRQDLEMISLGEGESIEEGVGDTFWLDDERGILSESDAVPKA